MLDGSITTAPPRLLIELALSVCLSNTNCKQLRDAELYRSFDECTDAGKKLIRDHAAELAKLGYAIDGFTCRFVADHLDDDEI